MVVSAPPLELKNRTLHTKLPSFVMAIVNCTPDSFWEKSRAPIKKDGINKTTEHILEQFENGADIVDIGGESTRPGSSYVCDDEEIQRIIPLIESVRKHSSGVISVDTRKMSVLKEALRAGADIINDVSALEDDSELVHLIAKEKIPVILMHKRGSPLTMQQNTVYNNIIDDIAKYLSTRMMFAVSNGIDPTKIILDAGIGFAKETRDSSVLITASSLIEEAVVSLCSQKPFGVLVGLSRKTCIGDVVSRPIAQRLAGTLAANMLASQNGARILRVHDVGETVDMLKVLRDMG